MTIPFNPAIRAIKLAQQCTESILFREGIFPVFTILTIVKENIILMIKIYHHEHDKHHLLDINFLDKSRENAAFEITASSDEEFVVAVPVQCQHS